MQVQNIQNTQEYTTYCGGSTEVRAETPLDSIEMLSSDWFDG